jgi:acyl transferase domain-containing protein/acyl carrier protein
LSEGRCAISRIPADRFPIEVFGHPRAGADVPGRSYTFAAGILDDVWGFDPTAFGISPREAAQMDPQQRHLLEVTYEALEHAGLRPSRLSGSGVGVYVGASSSDYATRFMFDPSAVDVHMMTGNTLSLISNRLSYCFDLRGPSFTVDTACSSSLVAMHVALEAIRGGKIDTAIVGGVNLLLSPFSFLGFSRALMLSPSGLCRAFDASGDGYVRAEGALALVLRAEDVARRSGDRIHAVVVGSGINQDGRTAGLSLPSTDAQAALLAQVYRDCGVSPDHLAFVEAHGTGTRVGDPAEAAALGRVLGQRRSRALPIGSVKTNIGHLEPASGLAGVVKAIMALEHGVLPPSLHFKDPNPDIRFDELNIEVAAQPTKLANGRHLRHAGVNSFGFGGSNAHVVLREPSRSRAAAEARSDGAGPLVISAHGGGALKALIERYAECIPKEAGGASAAICNAAAHTRDLLPERMVVAGPNVGASLAAHISGQFAPALWRGTALGRDLDSAFVFAGNGTQWVGMGLLAYRTNAAFRDALQSFDARFKERAGWSAVDALQSPELAVDIRRASRAQPLLLALQIATVEALGAQGLRPSIAIGHSVGEIAAAWCAGGLDLEGAIRVVLARSRRQETTRHAGGMAAVLVSAAEMQSLLARGTFPGLEIAAINSTRSVTVSGPTVVLDRFIKYAEQERWGVRRLDLDYPFHCALVDPIEGQLVADLAELRPLPTRIPLISTVTGDEIAGAALDADYWWQNVRRPVRFMAAMDVVCRRGIRVHVEVGPRQVLGGYLQDALRRHNAQGAVIPTLDHNTEQPVDEIVAAAARVLVAGGRVDLDRLVGPPARPAAELPNYPWQRSQIGFPGTGEAVGIYAPLPHPLLGAVARAESNEWFATVDPAQFSWLDDHRIEDAAVFPAAGFAEIALAAARQTFGPGALEVRDLDILQPLVFDGVRSFELMTRVSHDTHVVEIRSRPRPNGDQWVVHVQATVAPAPVADGAAEAPAQPSGASFDSARLYELTRRRGFFYGPAFRRVASADVIDDRTARVLFQRASSPSDRFVLDPTALDAAFHALFALAETDRELPNDARLLPVHMASLRVFRPGAEVTQGIARVTSTTPRSRIADFTLVDASGALVAQASQVRFRVAPRVVREASDEIAYRASFVNLHEPSQPSALSRLGASAPASMLAKEARAAGETDETRDVCLVLGAAVRTAAYDAVKNLIGDATRIVLPELMAAGCLAPSSWPLMTRLLQALADAALAHETDQGWELARPPELSTVGELVELLLTRYPAWGAEAACLARLPELLPPLLRKGLNSGAGYGAAVLEHLELGSPASLRLTEVVARATSEILAQWPQGSPLRVLVVGAANLPMAEKLLPAVAALHGLLVVTDIDTDRLDAARRGRFEAASKRLHIANWDRAIDLAAGGYDLIICARALHHVASAPGALELLAQTLLKDGALLAAEPRPSAFLDLVCGHAPAWWTNSVNPDFPIGAILSDHDWRHALGAAGFQAAIVQPFGKDGLDGYLISALGRDNTVASARETSSRSMLVVADAIPDSRALAELLVPRLEGAASVVQAGPGHGGHGPRGPRHVRVADLQESPAAASAIADAVADPAITDIVIVAADRAPSHDPMARLSHQCRATIQVMRSLAGRGAARLWIVCSGAVDGVVNDAAPNPTQTGLWGMARVLQNEFAHIEVRCIDVDPSMAMDVAADRLADAIAHPTAERELRLHPAGRSALRVQRGGILPLSSSARAGAESILRLDATPTGSSNAFVWRTAPRCAPKPDEVEIQVAATGLNFRDVMLSLGMLPEEALESGFNGLTIGMECAGVVSAVGSAARGLQVGDRVVAFAAGAFASHVVAGAHTVARIPDAISTEAAATLPVAFLTASYALEHLAHLQAGETVLVHGGAGGVGLAALQLAKRRGATVIATAGSPDRRALLRALGAHHVLDSRSLAFVDDVRRVTQGGGVDVVLNSLAGEAMVRSVDCLKPFGRFLELGKRDYYANRHLGLRPFRNNLSYFGIDADQLLNSQRLTIENLFAQLMKLVEDGELAPLPYRVFEASDAAQAFRLMQRSGHIGKILVVPPRSIPRESKPRSMAPDDFAVSPRARYLIVGGLGGLGLATAQWLALKGARHLVLMGRSAKVTDEAAGVLADLRGKNADVELAAVDVGDRAALERYLKTLEGGDIPLKGVFHAAMVIDDALAKDLDRSRIDAVLWPKVAGAAHLDQLTRRFDLDCFVLFSSSSVLVGNPGQAGYVAANAFLEALARRRRAEGLPALAVGWGAIRDVGYLARNAPVSRALGRRLGGAALTAAEALAGLDRLLARDPRDVRGAALGYGRIDWALARRQLTVVRTPSFDDLQLKDAADGPAAMAPEELVRMLRELPDAEIETKLADLIVANIAQTLRLTDADVGRNRALSELGMDSLMMLELRMAVEERLGIEIPLMSLTSNLTAADISKRLTAMLRRQENAIVSRPISVLAQEHVDVPETATDADVAAAAAAVARRAKTVDGVL